MPFDQNHSEIVQENKTYDYSINNNDGTVATDVIWNATEGFIGGAYEFNGTSDAEGYITVPNTASVKGQDSATISLWFRTYAYQGINENPGLYYEPTDLDGYTKFGIFQRANGSMSSSGRDTSSGSVFTVYSDAPSLNQWHHAVSTWDNTSDLLILYIDGVEASRNTATKGALYNGAPAKIIIGGFFQSAISYNTIFNGTIDEVMILNVSLNSTQILDLYNNQTSRFSNPSFQTYKSIDLMGSNDYIDDTRANITITSQQNFAGNNVSALVGYWNITDGYDDTNESLVASYHFDNRSEYENATHVFDWSNNNHNGTIIGALYNDSSNCKYSSCLSFDGSTNYINVKGDGIPTGAFPRTYSFWVRRGTTGIFANYFYFFAHGIAGNYHRIGMYTEIGSYNLFFHGYSYDYDTGIDLVDTEWHQIVITFNGTYTNTYFDGIESSAGETDRSLLDTYAGNLTIGSSTVVNQYWNGAIDDFLVYNVSLTADEVKRQYIEGSLNYNDVGWYNFSAGTDTKEFTIGNNSEYLRVKLKQETDKNNFYSTAVISNLTVTLFDGEYIPPEVQGLPLEILSPNGYYLNPHIDFNITGNSLSYCNVSFEGTNYELTEFNTTLFYLTNETITQGLKTAYFSCNDTAGNLNDTQTRDFEYRIINYSIIDDGYISENDGGVWEFTKTNGSSSLIFGGQTGLVLEKAYMYFNLTHPHFIPSDAVIINVTLNMTTSNTGSGNTLFKDLYADFTTTNDSLIYVDSGNGTTYLTSDYTLVNGSKLYNLTNARTDIQNAIAKGWWGLGIISDNEGDEKQVNSSQALGVYPDLLIDYIIPLDLFIISPTNTTYNFAEIDLNVTQTSKSENVDTWWYSFNNGNTNTTFNPNTTITSSEGSNNLTVWVNDSYFNVNTTSVVFVVDSIAPVLTTTYPENLTYNHQIVEMNYTYVEVNCVSVWASEDNGDTNTSFQTCGNNFTGLTSDEGTNNWTIWMNDTANNIGIASVVFVTDSVYPTFSNYADNNGSHEASGVGNFTVDVLNTNGTVLLFINNTNYTAEEYTTGKYNTSVDFLTNDTWSYYWISYSNFSVNINTSEEELRYYTINNTLEVTPPIMTILYPENLTYSLNVSELNYTFIETNPDSCWYSIDNGDTNSSAILMGNNFTDVESVEGSNNWTLWCNDTANNEGIASVVFVKDTIFPVLTIYSPTNTTYGRNNISINFTADQFENLWFYNGTDNITYINNTWMEQNLSDGQHIFIFYANDTAGNLNDTMQVTFVIDTIFPIIEITYPTASYNHQIVEMNYTWTEINCNSVWMSEDNGDTNISFQTCGDNFTSLTSDENLNNWTLWMNDTAGNEQTVSTTFIQDTIIPIMSITTPLNATYATREGDFNYTFTEVNKDSCWYSNDNGDINSTPVVMEINFTEVITTESTNNRTLYCNDSAGNEGTSSVVFISDTIFPGVTIISPKSKTYNEGNITINFTSDDWDTLWFYNGTGDTIYINDTWIEQNFSEDDTYTFIFYANDSAGNINDTERVTFTLLSFISACDIRSSGIIISLNQLLFVLTVLDKNANPADNSTTVIYTNCYDEIGTSIENPDIISTGSGEWQGNLTVENAGVCHFSGSTLDTFCKGNSIVWSMLNAQTNETVGVINETTSDIKILINEINSTTWNILNNITTFQNDLTDIINRLIDSKEYSQEQVYLITDAVSSIEDIKQEIKKNNINPDEGYKKAKEIYEDTKIMENDKFNYKTLLFIFGITLATILVAIFFVFISKFREVKKNEKTNNTNNFDFVEHRIDDFSSSYD